MLRRHTLPALLPLLLVLLTACEKEIDIDYHESEPLYVVEGSITDQQTTVRITMTRPMGVRENTLVEDATVTISSGDSISERVTYNRNGFYTSRLRGVVGKEYTLDVHVGGQHFTSTSTMQPKATVSDFRFVWKKMLTEKILFADLRLQDIPHATNYYFMHIYRNNIGYRWAVMRDTQSPGGELQQLFSCMREKTDENDADYLHEGDRLRLEVRAIDRASYDYLFSMQLMENTYTNPIANFSGGCLGYFSAYTPLTVERTFSYADVEEE